MTEFVGAEKPSLEELVHFGVKGMKWGQRKGPTTLGSKLNDAVRDVETGLAINNLGDPNHPSGKTIRDARDRVAAQKRGIRAAKKDVRKAKRRGEDTSTGKSKISEMQASLLRNPDRITASRMTKGETAVSILFAQPGEIAGRMIKTKLIELEVKNASK